MVHLDSFLTLPFGCSFLISMNFSPIKRGNFFERPKMATHNNTVDISLAFTRWIYCPFRCYNNNMQSRHIILQRYSYLCHCKDPTSFVESFIMGHREFSITNTTLSMFTLKQQLNSQCKNKIPSCASCFR